MKTIRTTQKRPRVGDEAYEVEWCANMPLDENGDCDFDAAEYHAEMLRTHTAAHNRAKEVLPLSCHGVAMVMPMRFAAYDDEDAHLRPHVGFWEATGDAEYVEE